MSPTNVKTILTPSVIDEFCQILDFIQKESYSVDHFLCVASFAEYYALEIPLGYCM